MSDMPEVLVIIEEIGLKILGDQVEAKDWLQCDTGRHMQVALVWCQHRWRAPWAGGPVRSWGLSAVWHGETRTGGSSMCVQEEGTMSLRKRNWTQEVHGPVWALCLVLYCFVSSFCDSLVWHMFGLMSLLDTTIVCSSVEHLLLVDFSKFNLHQSLLDVNLMEHSGEWNISGFGN